MSTLRFQLHSIQLKKENGFETYFPYHTIFSLIFGFHLGRHLGYIKMLNDARVASLGFFKDNVCTTRINKEKTLKSSSRSSLNSPKFCRTKKLIGIEKVPTIKAKEKWTKKFPQQEMNWSQFYQMSFSCTVDVKLRTFTYRYLHENDTK